MVRPISALHEGAQRIGAGDLDQKIDVRTGDELEALAGQFNRMTEQLRESYAGLERKVEERTAELQRGARVPDRDQRDPARDQQLADRHAAGVRRDRRERAAAVRQPDRRVALAAPTAPGALAATATGARRRSSICEPLTRLRSTTARLTRPRDPCAPATVSMHVRPIRATRRTGQTAQRRRAAGRPHDRPRR